MTPRPAAARAPPAVHPRLERDGAAGQRHAVQQRRVVLLLIIIIAWLAAVRPAHTGNCISCGTLARVAGCRKMCNLGQLEHPREFGQLLPLALDQPEGIVECVAGAVPAAAACEKALGGALDLRAEHQGWKQHMHHGSDGESLLSTARGP
jgi:hypothetical protein